MRQAVVIYKYLRALLIVSALGLMTTACLGGKEFELHEVDAIANGPGFLTGDAGEATLDLQSGEFSIGDTAGLKIQNQRSLDIRRRRNRARRKQEGATGN